MLIILAAVALADPAQFRPSVSFTLGALAQTLPFIAFAVLAVAVLKATGADALVARAFVGRETRMIVLAALVGGLAPFCSCEVIPFVAALLALGTPVSGGDGVLAVLAADGPPPPSSSPPARSAGRLPSARPWLPSASALMGGFAVQAAMGAGFFANPVRPREAGGCCGRPERVRRCAGMALLGRCRPPAALRVRGAGQCALPAQMADARLPAGEPDAGLAAGGGQLRARSAARGCCRSSSRRWWGAPAYLNGYAAPALVAGLIEQGMTNGAGMAFMVAGAVSCIPAMTAVYALVRRPVFAAYVGLGFAGAVLSGIVFGVLFPTL